MSNKEFGALSLEQFKKLIDRIPELLDEGRRLRVDIASLPSERLDELFGVDFEWSWVYELPFVEHVALLVVMFGMHGMLTAANSSADPQQCILSEIGADEWEVSVGDGVPFPLAAALIIALERTIGSISTYQRSLSSLVQAVRDHDDTRALFMAVRLDRTIVSCPTIASRIARAEVTDDGDFFKGLRNALKGPSRRYWQGDFVKMRFSLVLLRDMGVDSMSDREIDDLFQKTLRLFVHGQANIKNIRAHYQASRKIPTI